MNAVMSMQGADVTPTTGQVAAAAKARADASAAMRAWNTLKTTELAAFNAKRATAGRPGVRAPRD
jgi:hypothetical protein